MNHAQTSVLASVLAAADRLVEAFGNHDTSAYFAAFAPDASFIFYNLDRVLRSRAEYETEWQLWESRDGFRVLGCKSTDRAVSAAGDAAVFSHTVETAVAFGEQQVTNLERETIVFSRNEAGAWLAIHEHLSAMPVVA